jgi:hypothetical protein
VNENDFDFRPPPERREPKQFQPPPWEEGAFQQLQKDRGYEEPAAEERAPAEKSEPAAEARPAEAAKAPVAEKPATAEKDAAAKLDEAAMIEMFARLSEEDPPATKSVFKVAIGSAMVLFAVGGMMLVWAMAALVAARRAGTFALLTAFTLALFGIGFMAAGWWLVQKAMKRRGVR